MTAEELRALRKFVIRETLTTIAERTGTTAMSISRWERGLHRIPVEFERTLKRVYQIDDETIAAARYVMQGMELIAMQRRGLTAKHQAN